MKKVFIGFIAGVLFMIGSTAATAAIKQYILTEAAYPIFVNGKEYKDTDRPILNYEGSTYVPLAKLGDLTGVNYAWNGELRRVEIEMHKLPQTILTPDIKVEIDESDFKGYKGVRDDEDPMLHKYDIYGRTELPPLLSEGWVSDDLLNEVYRIYTVPDYEKVGSNYIDNFDILHFKRNDSLLITLHFPERWSTLTDGETIADGVKVKRYLKTNYYNIKDLEEALGIS